MGGYWFLLVCSLVSLPQGRVYSLSLSKRSTSPFPREAVVEPSPNSRKRATAEDFDRSESESEHLSRRSVPPYTFVSPISGSSQKICYDCDTECQAAISGSVGWFFYTVTIELNVIFAEIGLKFYYEVVYTGDVQMLNPNDPIDTSKSFQKFVDLMKSYWVDSGRAVEHRQNYGCDINILVGKDTFFDVYDDYVGVTYLMGLCTDEAVIVEKLMSDNVWMASGLAHEIGHLMGMVHAKASVQPYYKDYPEVLEQCPNTNRPTCGSQKDYIYKCIMISTLVGSNPPNEISDCSKAQMVAYIDMLSRVDTSVHTHFRDSYECLNLIEGSGVAPTPSEGYGDPPPEGSGLI